MKAFPERRMLKEIVVELICDFLNISETFSTIFQIIILNALLEMFGKKNLALPLRNRISCKTFDLNCGRIYLKIGEIYANIPKEIHTDVT